MTATFRIGNKEVSDDSPAFVIAEVGHNHQGDVDKCKAIFAAAADAGADAVKLQSYTPDRFISAGARFKTITSGQGTLFATDNSQ